MKHEILLGLTTTPASDWRGKVEEMKKFGIKRVALFPTFLEIDKRKELYKLLEEIAELEVPHVHLRNDMSMDEVAYLKEKFKTEFFNIHPSGTRHDFSDEFTKFSSQTYVENLRMVPKEEELKKYAGLCIDFSHWENGKRKKDTGFDPLLDYDLAMLDRLKNSIVGCCHVSVIRSRFNPINHILGFDRHYLLRLQELNYLSGYEKYLPKYISLELENTFERQLEVKKYLEKMLDLN